MNQERWNTHKLQRSLVRLASIAMILIFSSACQSPSPVKADPSTDHDSSTTQSSNNIADQATVPATTVQNNASSPADNNTAPNSNAQPEPFNTTSPTLTGNLSHPELSETSGLASSTRRHNTLWAINDGGNQPKLYALSHTGESLANFNVAAKNLDWEDLASAWINGESYLLIADIGDNQQRKQAHNIYILTEPLLDNRAVEPLVPVATLQFKYPDGEHNAESMSFADGWVYILTKEPLVNDKRQASQVYRIPLDLTSHSDVLVAEKIANLSIPSLSVESSLIASVSGVDISQPTAFDIDEQNQYAYVLTYRTVYRYKRNDNESWAEVFARTRKRVHTHSLSQAEALAVDANGIVWFTSEKRPAPLWALPGAR